MSELTITKGSWFCKLFQPQGNPLYVKEVSTPEQHYLVCTYIRLVLSIPHGCIKFSSPSVI